jgi:outer membrane protein assembly factor BamB
MAATLRSRVLHARNAKDLSPLWSVGIAPESDATPAIADGVVYYADMLGRAIAVNLADGKLRWTQELGREFMRCPVVTPKHVVYGCRDGMLIVLDRASGKTLWERKLNTRFLYEPLLVNGDRLLVIDGGMMKTLALDGKGEPTTVNWHGKKRGDKEDRQYEVDPGDPIVSMTWYKGTIITVPRSGDGGHTTHQVNYAWHVIGGAFDIWMPPPRPEPVTDDKKKEDGK